MGGIGNGSGSIPGDLRADRIRELFEREASEIDLCEISKPKGTEGPVVKAEPITPPYVASAEPTGELDDAEDTPYKAVRPSIAMREGTTALNFGNRRPAISKTGGIPS